MPTDHAVQTVTIEAPFDTVLATIRNVESQTEWVKEVLEAELLEEYEDGLPATATFHSTTTIGTDRYTLSYDHVDDGMSWELVKGKLQTAQNGRYTLRALGADRTEVTFDLTISHNLPVPGFIRSRVIKGVVNSTVSGLKTYLES